MPDSLVGMQGHHLKYCLSFECWLSHWIEIARNRGFLVVIEQASTSLLLSVTVERKINQEHSD